MKVSENTCPAKFLLFSKLQTTKTW